MNPTFVKSVQSRTLASSQHLSKTAPPRCHLRLIVAHFNASTSLHAFRSCVNIILLRLSLPSFRFSSDPPPTPRSYDLIGRSTTSSSSTESDRPSGGSRPLAAAPDRKLRSRTSAGVNGATNRSSANNNQVHPQEEDEEEVGNAPAICLFGAPQPAASARSPPTSTTVPHRAPPEAPPSSAGGRRRRGVAGSVTAGAGEDDPTAGTESGAAVDGVGLRDAARGRVRTSSGRAARTNGLAYEQEEEEEGEEVETEVQLEGGKAAGEEGGLGECDPRTGADTPEDSDTDTVQK